ncbi:hypothetical protein YGAWVPHU_CDS0053 [Salmonella phage SeKF_13]
MQNHPFLAHPTGLEPVTSCLEDSGTVQLF